MSCDDLLIYFKRYSPQSIEIAKDKSKFFMTFSCKKDAERAKLANGAIINKSKIIFLEQVSDSLQKASKQHDNDSDDALFRAAVRDRQSNCNKNDEDKDKDKDVDEDEGINEIKNGDSNVKEFVSPCSCSQGEVKECLITEGEKQKEPRSLQSNVEFNADESTIRYSPNTLYGEFRLRFADAIECAIEQTSIFADKLSCFREEAELLFKNDPTLNTEYKTVRLTDKTGQIVAQKIFVPYCSYNGHIVKKISALCCKKEAQWETEELYSDIPFTDLRIFIGEEVEESLSKDVTSNYKVLIKKEIVNEIIDPKNIVVDNWPNVFLVLIFVNLLLFIICYLKSCLCYSVKSTLNYYLNSQKSQNSRTVKLSKHFMMK